MNNNIKNNNQNNNQNNNKNIIIQDTNNKEGIKYIF